MKWKELLNAPYPTYYQRWKAVVLPSVIVFLILYMFQPFGISQIEGNRLAVVLGSALISAGASGIFVYLLPWLFPTYYKEENWTLGKQLLSLMELFLLITVGVWLYQSWRMEVPLDGQLFVIVLFWVLLLAPFPTAFFLMWNRNLELSENLEKATEMNRCLSEKIALRRSEETSEASVEEKASETLLFTGGAKERLEVSAADFLYAEAEGNYVKLSYRSEKEGKVVCKLLRITMKQAEEAVAAVPFLIRCHRAFLVNIQKVVRVDGNSQGYRLRLEGCEEEVPVSRAYAKEVKTLIENLVKG